MYFCIIVLMLIAIQPIFGQTPPTLEPSDPIFPPPSVLPNAFERHRFSVETFYGLDNDLTDTGWPFLNSPTSYHLDTQLNVHLSHAIAMRRLHCNRYYRHAKTHPFIRVPFCEAGIVLDYNSFNWEEPNPNVLLGSTGGYFNYVLYDSTGHCREGTDYGSAFLRKIINRAHKADHTIGLYVQAPHDVFFETQLPTHFVTPSQPPLGLATPISPTLSLCRTIQNFDSLLTYPNGLEVSEYTDYDNESLPSNYEVVVGYDTLFDEIADTIISITPVYLESHHICISSPEWLATSAQRYGIMAKNGADYIAFDVRHMPEKGCFCIWCRMKYASLYSGGDPNNIGYDNWDLFVNRYVAFDDIDGLVGPFKPLQDRRLHDFTNVIQKEGFKMYQDTMHHYGPNQPYGTLGVVSVQDLGGLNMEDYRTDFANLVDIPKTEWFTPIKNANNKVFFGEEYIEIPCAGQLDLSCGDVGCISNDSSSCDKAINYLSILGDYYIPEDIRTAGAFTLLRDVSKYGRTFLWLPYFYLRNKTQNNSVRNNQRLQTYLGFGYVVGGMTSTTLGNFYKMDTLATDGVVLSEGFNNLWDFTNITSTGQIDTVNPSGSLISNIFDSDESMSELLAGLKEVAYAAVLYSEEELLRYHYINNGTAVNQAAATLPIPSNAPALSEKPSARRQALVWWYNLLHMYGAFNSIYNSNPIYDMGGGQVSYKYPTKTVSDWQLNGKYLDQDVTLLIPVPITSDDVLANDPFQSLTAPTRDALDQLPNIKIPVFRNRQWYRKGEDIANTQLQYDLRQSVVGVIGTPDIYVTGHTSNAHTAHAGFYANETNTRVSVPLVIEPMYAIPRTRYLRDTSDVWQLEEMEDLDLETTPANAYDHEPLSVAKGDLIIHIKKANGAKFYTSHISDYTVTAAFSDLVASQGQILSLQITETTDEYIVKVPAFTCSMVVCIDIAK